MKVNERVDVEGEGEGEGEGGYTDPVIPVHVSEAHGNVVLTVSEGSVCIWFCGADIPV